MILEIRSTEDLSLLEEAVMATVGAQRLDVGLFHSRPYITFRRNIMRHLQDPTVPPLEGGVYFSAEQVVLRWLSTSPPTVWCGIKDAPILPDNEDI